MPSSYTQSLRLVLPVTGELTNLWGDTVNAGLTELVEDAIAGSAAITVGGSNVTLTTANEAADQARNMFLNLTGTPGAQRDVIVPAVSKLYFVHNGTTGGFGVQVRTSGGSGVVVPNGQRMALYCDGTNVLFAFGSAVGRDVLMAANAGAARTALGATATGAAVFTAANEAAARTSVGADVIPRNDGAFVTGHMRAITAGQTLNTGTANHVFMLYNDSDTNLTLTQGADVTLRLAGTLLQGDRTLLPRGVCTAFYVGAAVVLLSGDVV